MGFGGRESDVGENNVHHSSATTDLQNRRFLRGARKMAISVPRFEGFWSDVREGDIYYTRVTD